MPWVKGQSGNPGGRKAVPKDVRELARGYTAQAIETQAAIMMDPDAPHAARVKAADCLLNRAWGTPEGTTNLNLGVGGAFIELLRSVNERRAQDGAMAGSVAEPPERPAEIRH